MKNPSSRWQPLLQACLSRRSRQQPRASSLVIPKGSSVPIAALGASLLAHVLRMGHTSEAVRVSAIWCVVARRADIDALCDVCACELLHSVSSGCAVASYIRTRAGTHGHYLHVIRVKRGVKRAPQVAPDFSHLQMVNPLKSPCLDHSDAVVSESLTAAAGVAAAPGALLREPVVRA